MSLEYSELNYDLHVPEPDVSCHNKVHFYLERLQILGLNEYFTGLYGLIGYNVRFLK